MFTAYPLLKEYELVTYIYCGNLNSIYTQIQVLSYIFREMTSWLNLLERVER